MHAVPNKRGYSALRLKPVLRVMEQLLQRVAPEVRGSPDGSGTGSCVTTVQQCSYGSVWMLTIPARHSIVLDGVCTPVAKF